MLQQAIVGIDLDGVTGDLLGRVLATARERDTLTLWHLLARTEGGQRDRVFERLQALVPMPADVTGARAATRPRRASQVAGGTGLALVTM